MTKGFSPIRSTFLSSIRIRRVHESAVAALPEGGTVHPHARRALRVSGPREGRQQVWLEGERPPLPRFFGPAETDELLARTGGFNFRRDVWPLVEKELGFAHRRRVRGGPTGVRSSANRRSPPLWRIAVAAEKGAGVEKRAVVGGVAEGKGKGGGQGAGSWRSSCGPVPPTASSSYRV